MGRIKEEPVKTVTQCHQEKGDRGYETIVTWPSGRCLKISTETRATADSIVICDYSGSMELRLEFDALGPRLIVPGGGLRVEADDLVFLAKSMTFDVQNNVDWHVDGQFNVNSKSTNLISTDDTAINGRLIKLNCDPIPPESIANTMCDDEDQES